MTYSGSRAIVNSVTSILARDHADYFINGCYLGWVRADLINPAEHAPKTIGEQYLNPM